MRAPHGLETPVLYCAKDKYLGDRFAMCGYFGNLHESPAVVDLMNQLGLPLPYPHGQFYPRRLAPGLVTMPAGQSTAQVSPALWWYQLDFKNETAVINEKITSFNARDLQKPLWRHAIKHRRALVFATELGESQDKNRYLMRSKEGFALGALFKDWPDGTRSFAIITRPPHPRFSKYHEKSTPLFLPLDIAFLSEWLSPEVQQSDAIDAILDQPGITTDLEVTPVKTYKHADACGETQLLKKDR